MKSSSRGKGPRHYNDQSQDSSAQDTQSSTSSAFCEPEDRRGHPMLESADIPSDSSMLSSSSNGSRKIHMKVPRKKDVKGNYLPHHHHHTHITDSSVGEESTFSSAIDSDDRNSREILAPPSEFKAQKPAAIPPEKVDDFSENSELSTSALTDINMPTAVSQEITELGKAWSHEDSEDEDPTFTCLPDDFDKRPPKAKSSKFMRPSIRQRTDGDTLIDSDDDKPSENPIPKVEAPAHAQESPKVRVRVKKQKDSEDFSDEQLSKALPKIKFSFEKRPTDPLLFPQIRQIKGPELLPKVSPQKSASSDAVIAKIKPLESRSENSLSNQKIELLQEIPINSESYTEDTTKSLEEEEKRVVPEPRVVKQQPKAQSAPALPLMPDLGKAPSERSISKNSPQSPKPAEHKTADESTDESARNVSTFSSKYSVESRQPKTNTQQQSADVETFLSSMINSISSGQGSPNPPTESNPPKGLYVDQESQTEEPPKVERSKMMLTEEIQTDEEEILNSSVRKDTISSQSVTEGTLTTSLSDEDNTTELSESGSPKATKTETSASNDSEETNEDEEEASDESDEKQSSSNDEEESSSSNEEEEKSDDNGGKSPDNSSGSEEEEGSSSNEEEEKSDGKSRDSSSNDEEEEVEIVEEIIEEEEVEEEM